MKQLALLLLTAFALEVSAYNFTLQEIYDAGLPVVTIETVNREIPTCDEVLPPPDCMGASITNATQVPGRIIIEKGKTTLYDSGEYKEDESGMTIRIRGNSSAWADKKPYKIKLQKKADLLRRGDDSKYKDKHWLLIKDEHIKARTGFKLNELMEMQWTPGHEYVNVIFNDDYIGVYLLVESVRRNTDCRLNVSETGYIFEYDAYWWNEDVYVECTSNESMHFTFKYPDPEEITDSQIADFTDMIRKVENSLLDGSYEDYIDVPSFASWLLAQDILGNWDSGGSNYFLTKYDNTDNSKIMFGNLWDFDAIFEMHDAWGNVHGYGWFYYPHLLADELFVKTYKARWEEVSPTIFDEMIKDLEAFATSEEGEALDKSFALDYERWATEHESISQYVQDAKDWFISREAWLASAIANMELPSGIRNTPMSAQGDNTIYNLQGQKVVNPSKGIYIQNGRKIIWR